MVDSHDAETYSAKDSRLIWIDCEMTGLDIFGGDELVEVSVVPTDFDLNVLDEGVDYVIKRVFSQAASTVTAALCRSSDTSGVTRRAGAPWLPCSAALTIKCIVTAADRMLCAIRQNDSGGGITGNVGG